MRNFLNFIHYVQLRKSFNNYDYTLLPILHNRLIHQKEEKISHKKQFLCYFVS